MITNYYTLLKIEPSADLATIKKAFRREIAIYHPENNTSPSAKAQFELLVEAFDVLSNSEKRKGYDELLQAQTKNKPVVIEQKQHYKEWQKEAKKKSEKYETYGLDELLVIDSFNFVDDEIIDSLISTTNDLSDDLTDSLGDIFDLF